MQILDSEFQVGAEFVVYENGSLVHCGIFQLADRNSVFDAELYAILQALLWILSNISAGGKLRMVSDSLSSLLAIRNVSSYQSLTVLIKDICSRPSLKVL